MDDLDLDKISIDQLLTKIHVMLAMGCGGLSTGHPLRNELEKLQEFCKDQIRITDETTE